MADPITRSGSAYTSPRDGNRVPAVFGVSTVDGITPVPLEVNPLTGQLQVSNDSSQPTRGIVNPITQLTLSSTAETILINATPGYYCDIISLVIINTSASPTKVDFRDSPAGTIRMSLYVPGGDTRGISLVTPLPQAVADYAWTVENNAGVSSITISGTYITNT